MNSILGIGFMFGWIASIGWFLMIMSGVLGSVFSLDWLTGISFWQMFWLVFLFYVVKVIFIRIERNGQID